MAFGKNEISEISGVKPGETASIKLVGGKEGFIYHSVIPRIVHGAVPALMTRASMLTEIDTIALRAGSDYLWPKMPIADFLAIKNFYGIAQVDGMLPVSFSPVYMEEQRDRRELALGTLDTGDCHLEIKFQPTVISPAMEATAFYYIAPNAPLGNFLEYVTDYYGYAGAGGDYVIKDLSLDGPAGTGLKAMHFSTTSFSKLEFVVSNAQGTEIPLWRGRQDVDDYLMDYKTFQTNGRAVQPGFTHIDFAGNSYGDVQNMDKWGKHKLTLTMTAAANWRIITEKVTPSFNRKSIK